MKRFFAKEFNAIPTYMSEFIVSHLQTTHADYGLRFGKFWCFLRHVFNIRALSGHFPVEVSANTDDTCSQKS